MTRIGTIHQARLVDLKGLVKLWNFSETQIGLKIDSGGSLVPILFDPSDPEEQGTVSVKDMSEKAESTYPCIASEFDLVVNVYNPDRGRPEVRIATVDESLVLSKKLLEQWTFRWWTFTDDYKERLN